MMRHTNTISGHLTCFYLEGEDGAEVQLEVFWAVDGDGNIRVKAAGKRFSELKDSERQYVEMVLRKQAFPDVKDKVMQ